jgi:hypothetical protein
MKFGAVKGHGHTCKFRLNNYLSKLLNVVVQHFEVMLGQTLNHSL